MDDQLCVNWWMNVWNVLAGFYGWKVGVSPNNQASSLKLWIPIVASCIKSDLQIHTSKVANFLEKISYTMRTKLNWSITHCLAIMPLTTCPDMWAEPVYMNLYITNRHHHLFIHYTWRYKQNLSFPRIFIDRTPVRCCLHYTGQCTIEEKAVYQFTEHAKCCELEHRIG